MAADEEVTTELPLPGMELPEYHGRRPAKMKTSVSGTGNKIMTAHSIGDVVIAVVELKVKDAGHGLEGDDLVYSEKLTAVDYYEIQGPSGKRLLSAVRSAYRAATDGAEPLLDFSGDEGVTGRTDASGVVVTPGDAMSIADDPIVSALTDTSRTPVVVIYSDGGRELWPDEFGVNDPRPKLGAVVLDENDVESVVTKILDGVTGETLEEWTEEQEDARLLALESAAIAEEDRAEALEEFEILRGRNETEELEGADAERYVELREQFEAEARADREVMDGILPEGAVGDPTPLEQVDPPEANEDLDGDPEETFPGYASDGPDDELVIEDDVDQAPAEVVDPMPDDAPPPFDPERDPTPEECQFVDRDVKDLKPMIAELDDRDEVLGYLIAEDAGRGRKLKPRKGVLESLTKRAAELFTEEPVTPPALPTGGGFAPPEGDDEWEA